MSPTETKRCSKCGEVPRLDEFPRAAEKRDGRRSSCKVCDRAKAKAYYEKNREKVIARVSARYYETTADVPDYLRRRTSRRVAE